MKTYIIGLFSGVILFLCIGALPQQNILELEKRIYRLEIKANCTRAIVLECAETLKTLGNGDMLIDTYDQARLKEAQRRWLKENNRKSQDEVLEEYIWKLREGK